jgi:hypothetical protein
MPRWCLCPVEYGRTSAPPRGQMSHSFQVSSLEIMITQLNILCSISSQQRMRCTQRHALASLIAVASVSSLLVNSNDADETSRERIFYRRTLPSAGHSKCEENGHTTPGPATTEIATPQPLSRIIRLGYASKLYPYSYLPLPRLLTPLDPVFSYPELKRGLIRRHKDEERVRQILSSPQLMEARKNQDHEQIQSILKTMNSVVYGKGVTPQMREGKKHVCLWFMMRNIRAI